MSDFSMADIASLMSAGDAVTATKSTSRSGNTELTMQDFLQLMIVQLQNQTIDDAMDTSEMMNQMVQMQMVTAITNLTDASVMTYASSLVGKVVTIGIVEDNSLEEREIVVMGTGTMNGQQVIFGSDGNTYALSQIMAVGRLPDEDGNYTVGTPGTSGSTSGATGSTGSTSGATGSTDSTSGATGSTDSTSGTTGSDTADGADVVDGVDGTDTGAGGMTDDGGVTEDPEYTGEQGVPTD